MILNSPYITGSLTVTGNATIAGNITVTGSLSGTATSASYAYTASSAINATSASYAYTASSAINATSASKAVSSSYADTASFANNFTVIGNLTVFGTQSVQYITSSQLNISDNVITVNVASPGVRFGGLSVFDSGSLSSEATASLFWDSQNNHWIYQRESGSTYTGGMLISGPRNAAGLGNEQGTTNCMLLVGQGGDHLTSSMIYHDSAKTCFQNDVYINGDLRMSGTDSFIWTPTNCSNGFTGFYDGFNSHVSLVVCNSNGHLILQPTKCNVGIGTGNPANKLTINNNGNAAVAFRINDTNANSSFISLNASNTDAAIIAGGTSAIPFDIYTCGNIRMRIAANGNIGINNTCPANKLQICTTSTAENVVSITNGTQNLQLGLNNEVCGSYLFEKSNNALRLGTADTERMRITDTGIACFACQVCIANNLVIAGEGIFINRPAASSGEPYIFLQKDGVTRGSIYGADGSAGLRYFGASNCFEGIICAASGIRFSSGGSTLSAYETSTWTPFISRQSSAPTVSYSSREGTYTRIGNMIYVFWDLTVSSLSGGSGPGIICNLPITVSNSMAGYSVAQYRDASLVAANANTVLKGFAERGSNYIYLQYDNTGACGFNSNSTSVSFNASGRITGYVIYQV